MSVVERRRKVKSSGGSDQVEKLRWDEEESNNCRQYELESNLYGVLEVSKLSDMTSEEEFELLKYDHIYAHISEAM